MFISEKAAALEKAQKSGDQAKFNDAVVDILKDIAVQLDTLKLDIEETSEKSENMLSNFQYINANMQVIKEAIVGDIKVVTADDEYLNGDDANESCHDDDCSCGHDDCNCGDHYN